MTDHKTKISGGAATITVILFLALVHGLLYTFLVPPWQHYDEPNHFEYVWLIANRSQLPRPGDSDPVMRRAVATSMIDHDFFRGMGFLPDLDAADGQVWIGNYSQLDDPPFYYFLAALPLRAFPSADVTTQLILARLVSLALYLLTIAVAWALVGELVATLNPLRWLVPLTMALLPGFTDLMTAVNNDVGAVAVLALFLWGGVRLIKQVRPAAVFLFNAVWVLATAGLCLLTKSSAYVAMPLLLPLLLFALLRGRWRWLSWTVLAVAGGLGVLVMFWSPGAPAAWYAEVNQSALARQPDPFAPLGAHVFKLQALPGKAAPSSARFRQLLPSEVLQAHAGQAVTLGAWMWASQPVQASSPQVHLQGGEMLDVAATWVLDVQPTFHAFTFTVPLATSRGWINLVALTDAGSPVQLYADGLVLAVGSYPLDQPPAFDDPDGLAGWWGSSRFENWLRGASAEQRWPGVNPQLDALSARLLPDQGRLSLITYSLLDWPGGGTYYRGTAANLLRTFWAKFGWGHVPLTVAGSYRVLAAATLLGWAGAGGLLLVGWRRWSWEVRQGLAWLGFCLLAVWLNAITRGAIYVFQLHGFIPAARYAYPAMIPTILVLAAGWLGLARLLQWGLRLPQRFLLAVYLLAFIALDILALVTIVQFYA